MSDKLQLVANSDVGVDPVIRQTEVCRTLFMFDQFTLGIEEEFQIVDPQTRELRSHVAEILDEGKMILGEQIKPEMIQSQIEVGTVVCQNIQETRADVSNLRGVIPSLAEKN